MAEIRLENIRKLFKDIAVINGIGLTIKDGEFFTFVGPSGCGKSTILNMIAGLESPSAGKIYFDNTVMNELSPKERDVAMVFQSYALYPHMSVHENIAFPLRIKKTEQASLTEEVKRVATLLGLETMLHKKPKELSGGQRQRVALGRAIIRKPKVFLMDEPLSNLDARLRIAMRAELKKLHQQLGITTVYVTHDQSEAISLSDRVAVLNEGVIQQCGTPLEIYRKPANVFVGGFIGSPPMNFIRSSVQNLDPLEIDCDGIIISPTTVRLSEKTNLTIGIRPEDIIISAEKSGEGIAVDISIVEPAGSFNWVDVLWNHSNVKGRSGSDEKLKPGDKAFMRFPPEKVAVFDGDSGNSI